MQHSNGSARKNEPDVMKLTAVPDEGIALMAISGERQGLKLVASHSLAYHGNFIQGTLKLTDEEMFQVLMSMAHTFRDAK